MYNFFDSTQTFTKRISILLLGLALLLNGYQVYAFDKSISINDNPALKILYADDQKDRKNQTAEVDWAAIEIKDQERLSKVNYLIKFGKVKTSNDYWRAAIIYQHGSTPDDLKMAFALSQIAVNLNSNFKAAKWLRAASWDRILVESHAAQWYGTQYRKNSITGRWELYEINDSIVTDEERVQSGILPLKEIQEEIEQMNKK